jgi:aldehyde dehydrogenase (NAD+)
MDAPLHTAPLPANLASMEQEQVNDVVLQLRNAVLEEVPLSLKWRRSQLKALKLMLSENYERIKESLKTDLGRSNFEVMTEIDGIIADCSHAISNLKSWNKDDPVSLPVVHAMSSASIHHDPKGVVLIISPWNYPWNLCLGPLIGCIAAGNCAVIKPSELSPASSSLLEELCAKYLDTRAIRIIQGDKEVTMQLLSHQFDHIFYTGSGRVARIVMGAAAQFLTPVTLELGGKNPCIVWNDADLNLAAKRIAWCKTSNCGQLCLSVDYIICHQSTVEALTAKIRERFVKMFGENALMSADYGRIINELHTKRLVNLLEKTKGQIVAPGSDNAVPRWDEDAKYVAPLLVKNVQMDDILMQDEIFGPILPIVSIPDGADLNAALRLIQGLDKPLAIYCFSKSKSLWQAIKVRSRSGGLVINDCLIHFTVKTLPFGGIGGSGTGAYHGKYSFEEFSHSKSVLNATSVDLPLRYAPYTEKKETWAKKLFF